MDRRFLDTTEMAIYLNIQKKTLYNWIWQKYIPHHKFKKKLVRFDLKEIEPWLKDKKIKEIS